MFVTARFPLLIAIFLASVANIASADGLPQGGQIGDVTVSRDANGKLIAVPAGSAAGQTLRVCSAGCAFSSIAMALQSAGSGDVIVVESGVYTTGAVITANGITVMAKPGASLKGAVVEGKGAIVVKGNDTVIDGLECSDIAVPNRNGACVRQEGRNLTLRHVYFHDAEEGLLTGPNVGQVTIEDSLFERLGANGQAHAIYVGVTDGVTILRSKFLASRDQGHEVKSRAARTIIEDSVIASLDGVDSRLIDAPNGGEVVIRNSVLEKGPSSVNRNLIGFGLEGIAHDRNSLTLDGVEIIDDAPAMDLIQGIAHPVFRHVKIVGGVKPSVDLGSGVTWFQDRGSAKIGPYPQLPWRGG